MICLKKVKPAGVTHSFVKLTLIWVDAVVILEFARISESYRL